MPKLLAIDYGQKRTGLAITDDLQIIASPLETVETSGLMGYLEKLLSKENIVTIVVGEARHNDGSASEITLLQYRFVDQLKKKFPQIPIEREDERYTSSMAAQALFAGGMKKSDRQKKENLDKVSAALILQSYMNRKG